MKATSMSDRLSPSIIFEDEWFMAVNKPAGWVVNRAESVHDRTIQDWLETTYPSLYNLSPNGSNKTFLDRSGIAHRLDKETSGVLLVAKNPDSLAKAMDLFKRRLMTKQYMALAHGFVEPQKGFVRLPMARNIYNRAQFSIDPLGKSAHTDYHVSAYYTKPDAPEHFAKYSLLSLAPKTGRTHQIRVHCKYIGHPLVADALYTSKNQLPLDLAWCPRHFLHAGSLTFVHPETQVKVTFESPLPNDLVTALATLVKL
jgi:23S rRNA pseudouridine1911/1915/1917 synthase